MRLIDIEDISLLKTVSDGGLSAKALWRRICNQPTVDAEPVIRCKDCEYAKLIDKEDGWYECWHDKRVMHSDGYCSWAERMDEDDK